jgi:hypothetical protein
MPRGRCRFLDTPAKRTCVAQGFARASASPCCDRCAGSRRRPSAARTRSTTVAAGVSADARCTAAALDPVTTSGTRGCSMRSACTMRSPSVLLSDGSATWTSNDCSSADSSAKSPCATQMTSIPRSSRPATIRAPRNRSGSATSAIGRGSIARGKLSHVTNFRVRVTN